ncbi:MAG TPA: PAS domain S-box protein [Thermoanaerobaculia bacterium]|nr:PAS domain S-box protein [Thermoanaerobaculia bacterium]
MSRRAGLRTALGIALAAALLSVLVFVTARNARDLIEAGRWVEHARSVLDDVDGLGSALAMAESSSRGYALTGRADLLEPFASNVGAAEGHLQSLENLTADNPDQLRRIREVAALASQKISEMKRVVAERDRGGLAAAAESVTSGPGLDATNRIRRLSTDIRDAESKLLSRRTGTFERTARATLISLALGAALLFSFLALIGVLLRLDLARRAEAEQKLRLSEEELRTTLRSIGDGVVATDDRGCVTLMNPLAERLTGWTETEALGRDATEIFHIVNERTRQPVESPITRVLREGLVSGLANHTVLIARGGAEVPIADSGAPIRDAAGRLRGAVLVFRDIGATRRAELQANRLASIVSSSADAIVGEALDGTITAWNAAAEQLFGYSASEVMGRSVALLEAPGFEEATAQRLVRVRRGERVQQYDTVRMHRDGRRLAVSVSISPIYDEAGEVIGASKIVRDIAGRKDAESALRASEERFRLLSDSVSSLVWVCDEKGMATYVNRRWHDYSGQLKDDCLEEFWQRTVHPDDLPAFLAKWQVSVATGTPFEAEARFRRQDGSYRWFVARSARIPSRSGPIWVGTAADIDDLKNTAEALRSAKEAAEEAAHAKDRFLAVLSHELRTPLTPALAVSQVLERRGDLPGDVKDSVSLIRRNVELEVLLVDDLLDLTKIARGMVELKRQTVDVHELLQQVVDICRSDLNGRRQNLALELGAAEHHVDADAARLQQVFWNLLKNAIKFTPVGGSIAVRSETAEPGRMRIVVTDSGIGIPAGILPRIFEPFERGPKTVSPRASGLGLGLSISRTLVELHGGSIHADSEGEGRGATFTVELASFVEKGVTVSARRQAARRARKFSILLVEDHADTAGALGQLLQEEGHRVTVADSVGAALEAFRAVPTDLLITDLGLPDGSGHDLLARLRQIRPVQGIVLSGYGMDADVAKSKAAGFAFHLTKPVPIGRLLRTLDDLGSEAEAEAAG